MLTYTDLPFDVIHYICSAVKVIDGKTLLALSMVDRQTRTACIPFLFMEIIYDHQYYKSEIPWDGLEQSAEALLANETIKAAIRCVAPSQFRLI